MLEMVHLARDAPTGPTSRAHAPRKRFPNLMMRLVYFCFSGALMLATLLPVVAAPDLPPDQVEFFESRIRPLLVEHCYECHSQASGESSGALLLDSSAGMLKGGSQGTSIRPGDPQNSLVMQAVSYADPNLQMPPSGKLDPDQIDALRRWIEIGAPDPREADPSGAADDGGAAATPASPLDRDPRSHWAFVTPVSPEIPAPIDSSALDPIDTLVTAKLTEQNLQSAELADRAMLIRRLHFDLTGLPPSFDSIQAFVHSDRPDAYTRLVDDLLATPGFGLRFARHWMDVSRYANTIGYTTGGKSREIEGSERFRDWAIAAFANDMPYDQMILHQLSADRTDPANEHGNLDAMGFLTLGRQFLNHFDTRDDQIDVITRGLLGMTVACARCHDHKFDPISTADYYSMFGIVDNSVPAKDGASPLAWVDRDQPADRPILIRGQQGNHGPLAPRQFLTALRKADEPRFDDGSGRWELAQRIASSDNPLTARVMVNRIWGHLVGKPLVDTPSDFGFRTPPPAVPGLLDELAVDFSRHWSVKKLVRRIVLSRTYRQSSQPGQESLKADPDNRYLTRANRKRRDFESLRDTMLTVSGTLDRSLGGKPVNITESTPNPRQTIYAYINRQNLPAIFRTFDFASPDTHSPDRYYTTVPQQSLFLMNNDQMFQFARESAAKIRRAAESSEPSLLAATTFRILLGRQPNDQELDSCTAFLTQPIEPVEPRLDPRSIWSYGLATLIGEGAPGDFTPFETFQQERWQPRDEFPTKSPLGHASVTQSGGHTANQPDLAVIRRFTAPSSGSVKLTGKLGHGSDKGDGVRITVWIANERVLDRHCRNHESEFKIDSLPIEQGQTVDLVAQPGESPQFDTFSLAALIQLTTPDGRETSYGTRRHFSGPFATPTHQPVDRLGQLAQTLMMTNEFIFID